MRSQAEPGTESKILLRHHERSKKAMKEPRIYADFNNADREGRIRLNCAGTVEDLAQQHIELREGMALTLYSDDLDVKGDLDQLLVDGIVSYSRQEDCWVASIDWNAIRHASDAKSTTR